MRQQHLRSAHSPAPHIWYGASESHKPRIDQAEAVSKLKAHLRKAQERTLDTLWPRIGKLLDLFKPIECANFFANAGYART
jgi:hypothetical protein